VRKLKYIKLFESATSNSEDDIDQLYLSGMFDMIEYVRMYAENGLLNSSNCARTFWNMNGIRVYNLEHCHFAASNVIGGFDLTFANMRKYVMMMYKKYGVKFVYAPQWDTLFVGIDGSHAEITEHQANPIWPYIKDILGPTKFNSESDRLPDFGLGSK